MKHIGQTIQTVLKHLVGIEGVKVPSESSKRRMILESNLLAKLQVEEKMLSHGLTSVDITTLLESCMNEHEKESVVKAQITHFKWVMSPPNIDHKFFFFSKERKKLSCETLIQNLLKIVNHTNSVLTGIDTTLNIPKEQRKQLVLHKQDEHISAFQRSARNQNPTEERL